MLSTVSLLAVRAASAAFALFMASANVAPSWKDLKIGGGGYVTGLDIHSDGTLVCRTDVYGGYVRTTVIDVVSQQLVTASSMPGTYYIGPYNTQSGIYEVKIDPSNSSTLWMLYTAISGAGYTALLKSTDRGNTWTLNTAYGLTSANANDGNTRYQCGERIGIDPNNSNVVYVGNNSGLKFTTDGGSTWSTASGVATPTSDGVCAIQFDTTSGTTGGKTNRIICGSNGNGLYVSTNAGSSFSLVSGSTTAIGHSRIASDGNYYFIDYSSGKFWHLATDNTTLNSVTPSGSGLQCICIDPANPQRGVAVNINSGVLVFSGAINGSPTLAQAQAALTYTSPDIPWLGISAVLTYDGGIGNAIWDPFVATSTSSLTIETGTQNPMIGAGLNLAVGDTVRLTNTGTVTNYMLGTVSSYNSSTGACSISVGSVAPGGYLGSATGGSGTFSAWTVTKERIWCTFGSGLAYSDLKYSSSDTRAWNDQTAGQEHLGPSHACWPTSGNPILCTFDRPFWYITNAQLAGSAYASSYGPLTDGSINESSVAEFAVNAPTFIAYSTVNIIGSPTSQTYGYSTDGGQTYNPWPTGRTHAGTACTGMAVIDANHIVIASASALDVTADGGNTWSTPGSAPTSGWGSSGLFGIFRCLAADYSTVGTVYGFNYVSSTVQDTWKSTDYGATWTKVNSSNLGFNNNGYQLVAVPGNSGHLFLTIGATNDLGDPANLQDFATTFPIGEPFYRSTNGGTSWLQVSNVQDVICVDCGAAKPGGSGYPAVFIVGWVNQGSGYVYGVWRSDDSCSTWTKIGDYLMRFGNAGGWMGIPATICANKSAWNQCIVGFGGSGFALWS